MAETHAPVRELNLYRRYFDLVTAGTKTIEVRVKYPHLADLAAGDTIRFRIKGTDETCEVKVVRVTEYTDFEALLDGEGPSHVNPTAPKAKAVDPVTVRAAPADTPTGLTPLRSEGGHRRYSRYQLRIAARARELRADNHGRQRYEKTLTPRSWTWGSFVA